MNASSEDEAYDGAKELSLLPDPNLSDGDEAIQYHKKTKALVMPSEAENVDESGPLLVGGGSQKSKSIKKKYTGLWTGTSASRKGKKKGKAANNANSEDNLMLLTPLPKITDDIPDMTICLSELYKSEGVHISEDRLTAGSVKGYRMVRATRGVTDGAWYFEIKVLHLDPTGHTRLGWSTDKGDLQAPVGYDSNIYAYRDIDGSKFHNAMREEYGEQGYKEGDVIGFYIYLPDGSSYASKGPQLVPYKGHRFVCHSDAKEHPPKIVPGSEISFYKNGVCQGVAFKNLCGERYYPAASMYTLPSQPNCEVTFNFGPFFDCFPDDLGGRPVPKPMIEVPYMGLKVKLNLAFLTRNKSSMLYFDQCHFAEYFGERWSDLNFLLYDLP